MLLPSPSPQGRSPFSQCVSLLSPLLSTVARCTSSIVVQRRLQQRQRVTGMLLARAHASAYMHARTQPHAHARTHATRTRAHHAREHASTLTCAFAHASSAARDADGASAQSCSNAAGAARAAACGAVHPPATCGCAGMCALAPGRASLRPVGRVAYCISVGRHENSYLGHS